jgi:hypothetical protein
MAVLQVYSHTFLALIASGRGLLTAYKTRCRLTRYVGSSQVLVIEDFGLL